MKIVIITGASSGMGREFAVQLDDMLNSIDEYWLVGRNVEALNELADDLETKTRIFEADFEHRSSLFPLFKALDEEKPSVKMLINSAGFGKRGNLDDLSYKDALAMIDVNCRALTALSYAVIPFLAFDSRIINIASAAAFCPQPKFSVYAATKSYVLSLSRALSRELKDQEVYVTAVCPGPVATNFFARAERGQQPLNYKKYIMAAPKDVVKKALKDSILYGREVSVYGVSMKAGRLAAKILPHSFATQIMHKLNNI